VIAAILRLCYLVNYTYYTQNNLHQISSIQVFGGRYSDKRQTTNDKRQTTNDKRQTTNDKRQTTNDKGKNYKEELYPKYQLFNIKKLLY